MIAKHSRLLSSLAVVLYSLVHPSICAADHFHSASYGYHLDLPNGWVEIPRDAVQQMLAVVQKPDAATSIIYDAGFQLDSAEQWFEYPYVLVQPIPYASFGLHRQINEDEFPEMVRTVTGLDFDKIVDENISSDARQFLGEMDVGKPRLDAGNRRYLWTMNMDVQGIGPVRGLLAGNFGRDSIVQVAFYSRRADWDRYSDVRQAIVASFQFDPHKAYSAEVAAANPSPPSTWSSALRGGVFGGVTGGAVALVLGLIARAKRKKSATAANTAAEESR
jgi:hypothetical protein